MKVFVAGASGAIGRRLVPLLVDNGYEVAAMTRSREKARGLYELGAEPIVADGLDRSAVLEAVLRAEPEVVVDQMTGLAGVESFRRYDDELAPTTRLRTDGSDYLLEAVRVAGVRQVIAQSYGLWSYAGVRARLATEHDQLDPSPPPSMRRTLAGIRHVESAVPRADGIEGTVLRYGLFYGPGTGVAEGGPVVELVRKRRWPIVGDGAGVWSFVHVDDAASATLAAIERPAAGIFNIADDDPAPLAVWLPDLARVIGAKPPRHVPEWLGRLAAGESAVYLSTRIRGLSTTKANRELGWQPRYESWRDGFRHGLTEAPVPTRAHA